MERLADQPHARGVLAGEHAAAIGRVAGEHVLGDDPEERNAGDGRRGRRAAAVVVIVATAADRERDERERGCGRRDLTRGLGGGSPGGDGEQRGHAEPAHAAPPRKAPGSARLDGAGVDRGGQRLGRRGDRTRERARRARARLRRARTRAAVPAGGARSMKSRETVGPAGWGNGSYSPAPSWAAAGPVQATKRPRR